jgi:hypothetical protein
MNDQPGQGGFLPPQAPGPEPDLGAKPAPTPSPPPPEAPGGWQPPQQQPPPGYWQPQQQPPPGYWQPQQQPPGYWQAQPPGPQEPDNGPAVAGFVLALIGAGILLISVLLLAFVSLVLAILGIVYSRRGKRKIEAHETRKHKGIAQAGFVISIVTLVIAAPVTLLEIVFLIAYATDEEFRDDFQDDWDDEFNSSAIVLAVSILRGLARLLA